MTRLRGKQQLSMVGADEVGDTAAAAELSPYENFPSEDGEARTAEERVNLPEGYYILEAIRRKRMRKGAPQYLIKWRGFPESENSWEPLENLHNCKNDVELFEKSLKSGASSSCNRRRKGAGEKGRSTAAATSSGIDLNSELVEAEVQNGLVQVLEAQNDSHPTANGDKVLSQVPDHCTGAKRRKCSIPQRFIAEASTSNNIAGARDDIAELNAIYKMANNQDIQIGSYNDNQEIQIGSSSQRPPNNDITEILKMQHMMSTTTIDKTKQDWVTFLAKRADGSEVTVDAKFLKKFHYHLLFQFYEKYFYEKQSSSSGGGV